MTALILYIALAIGVSFVCSLLEAVLLSLTPSYVEVYRRSHPKLGQTLAELHQNVERPLAAILSLNTVAHTIGAAGAGAQAASVFGNVWVGLFSAALTLAILVLSEIIPKTIGANYWRALTPSLAIVLPWMIRLLLPLVWLSGWLTHLLRNESLVRVSRDEILAIARIGAEDGAIAPGESDLLENLLYFRDIQIADVMTPKSVVGMLDENQTIAFAVQQELPFSRIPVVNGSSGAISGYVLRDELLEHARSSNHVRDLRRDILEMRTSTALPWALNRFIGNRQQIAVVKNEHSEMLGVITLEDIIETLIGMEIVDEADPVVDMRALARRYARTRRHLPDLPTNRIDS